MAKQSKAIPLRRLLLDALVRSTIVIGICLFVISSLLIAINFKGIQLTHTQYPLIQKLNHARDALDESSTLLNAWLKDKSANSKTLLLRINDTVIPKLLKEAKSLANTDTNRQKIAHIQYQYIKLQQANWKIMGIAASTGHQMSGSSHQDLSNITTDTFADQYLSIQNNIVKLISNTQQAIDNTSKILLILGLTVLVIVILSLVIFIFFGRNFVKKLTEHIVQPIEMLTVDIKHIAQGKHEVKIPPQQLAEFNQLIQSFKDMAQQRQAYESSLRANERSLQHLAYHDSLTDLGNYQLLKKSLSGLAQKSSQAATSKQLLLCHIHLRHLDKLNTTWGRKMCDIFIKQFSKRIEQTQPNPTLVARLNSSEFILYFPVNAGFDAKQYLETLTQALSQPLQHQQSEIIFTIQVGAVICQTNQIIVSQLLQQASFAATQTSTTKPYKVFTDQDSVQLLRRSQIEQDIKNAINDQEITVVYQPQFDIKNGKLIGFEVLARWLHPQLGEIPPFEFVSIAEQSGQIIELGRHIQALSIKDIAAWSQEYNTPLKLSINASLLELTSKSYSQHLLKLTKQHQLAASQVEIEITETLVSAHYHSFIKMIRHLRKLQLSIAIDDFGTGYSSLDRLSSLEVDLLKIDQTFVKNITEDSKAKNLLHSIINMAKTLDLPVLAEGVETQAQLGALKKMQCNYGQGYYYSKALAPQDMRAFLSQHITRK